MAEMVSLPLPFCHAVYQDRLRKDVKKIIAVATVPFLSLISFQRCLSSAGLSGTRELPLPPSLRLSLPSGCCHGRGRRHMGSSNGKTPQLVRTVNTDLCCERRCSDIPSLGAPFLLVVRRDPPVPSYTDQSRVHWLSLQHSLHDRWRQKRLAADTIHYSFTDSR